MSIDKIVIVTKRTPLEELTERLNTRAQARFYLEQNGVPFTEYEQADAQYHRAVAALQAQLPRGVKQVQIERALLPGFQFGARDMVVTIGPDGLVINAAKYLDAQPILALNPDPARIDGVLATFGVAEAGAWITRTIRGDVPIKRVAMARAILNDGQTIDAVNDLFLGRRGHASARYTIEHAGQHEPHSSSGIIISTGAGSSGWLSSIIGGAWRVAQHFGAGETAPEPAQFRLDWADERLWYAVREPFVSKTSRASLVFGQIAPDAELVITSQMPDGGVIFSDGIESDALAFNSGAIARIGLAPRRTHLVVRS